MYTYCAITETHGDNDIRSTGSGTTKPLRCSLGVMRTNLGESLDVRDLVFGICGIVYLVRRDGIIGMFLVRIVS